MKILTLDETLKLPDRVYPRRLDRILDAKTTADVFVD